MDNEAHELLPKTPETIENRETTRLRSHESLKVVKRQGDASYASRLWSSVMSIFEDKPYEIRETWPMTIWYLTKRLLTLTILIGAITLGATQQSFDITSRNVWQKFQLNEDAQLAAFGLLNTILALMVRDSLGHITETIVTKWMLEDHGASALDFGMYDETIKPWVAITKAHARRTNNGWRLRDLVQSTICVITGICLLLQGASMNTIGMPKIRWWPDTRFIHPDPTDERLFFDMPAQRVASVSYMSMWDRGFHTIREGGPVSWEIAHALGAASTLEALEGIYAAFNQPAGWTFASQQDAMIRNAVNVTDTSTPSTQSVSIHGAASVDAWDEQRRRSKYAGIRRARGWEAKFKLNAISLETTCYAASGHPVGGWNASHQGNESVTIYIGPSFDSDKAFLGALCSITVGQALIHVTQWIVLDDINRDRPSYSMDEYGRNRFPGITPLSAFNGNRAIAEQLSNWFNAIIPNLQSISSNMAVTNLTALSLQLSDVIVKLDRGHTTTEGLARVLSVVFSNLLTTFSWTFEDVPGATVKHGPIRWQIYGSGPRLPWQWVSAAVIGVSILIQLVDIFYICIVRKAKGTWLSLGGMLVAANSAARMPSVTDSQGAGYMTEEGKSARYYIRQKSVRENHTEASLCDNAQVRGSKLDINRSYG